MGSPEKRRTNAALLTVTGLALFLMPASASGQPQDKGQQKCIAAMSKDGVKVGATQGKENTACIRNATQSKEPDPDGCLTADLKGKVLRASAKTLADFDKNCVLAPPDFGIPGVFGGTAAAVNEAAIDEELLLVRDIFGPSLAGVLVDARADKGGAKCQQAVTRNVEKIMATHLKNYLKCQKTALKAGGGAGTLEACINADPQGKTAKTIGKLASDIGKNCESNLLPGACSKPDFPLVLPRDGALLAACLAERVACHSCRTVNRMNGLHRNCDLIDDDRDDEGTCAAGRPSRCTLAPGSVFNTQAAVGTIPLPAVGSIDIAIGGTSGVNTASCEIRDIEPVNLPGVGFVCLAPGQGCPVGTVDCDGGGIGGTAMAANRNIGTCQGNLDCEVQCNQFCAASGSVSLGGGFGCEGFCSGPVEQTCTTDAECAASNNGACFGQDGLPDGNICQCICVNDAIGSVNAPGAISCQLGVDINVEVAAPCDGLDTLIPFGSICTPVTTGPSTGAFLNFNNQPGNTVIQAANGSGQSCFEQNANNTSGMRLAGHVPFFGSTLGDLLVQSILTCE
jgi:hypothetical protein